MDKSGAAGRGALLKPAIFAGAIIILFILSWVFHLGQQLAVARDWVASLGEWGPVVFGLIYVAAVVAVIPGSVLTVVAGALFGTVKGTIVVSIAATTGAGLAFLIARYVARDSVSAYLAGNERFRRLDEMARLHGAAIVAIVRLVPLFPFNIVNYGLGLTAVPFGTYVFWSWLCMLPGTVLYVAGTDAIYRAVREGRVPWTLAAVVAAAVVIVVFLARALGRRIKAGGEGQAEAGGAKERDDGHTG